jgi:hypothetical protein
MSVATLDDYRWLTSGKAHAWLEALRTDSRPLVQLAKQLRKELSEGRVHLLLELRELRRRAEVKFAAAQQLFFTRRGLEQATDQWIAAYKAERLPAEVPLADLCCGIGGDLFALAANSPVTGVDRDPVHALLAEVNCRALGTPAHGVETVDAAAIDLGNYQAWHIDPDRRPSQRRTAQPCWSSPPTEVIDRHLCRHPDGAVKLAPAATVSDAWQANAERQWIGSGRECKQQVAWFGQLAWHAGKHTVIVLNYRASRNRLLVGLPDKTVEPTGQLGRFICEPHAAVLAARLTGTLAEIHGLTGLDPQVEYLSSEYAVDDPLLSCFEVLERLPLDLKHLRAALRRHRIGQLEIKKRGVAIDPQNLRKRVQGRGERRATLVITPMSGKVHAVLCRRVTESID